MTTVYEFTVQTSKRREVIDLTRQVAEAGLGDGIACIAVPHCTCAVCVNEHEEGLVGDLLQVVEQLTQGRWRHDRIDNNAGAHLGAALLGNAVCLPVQGSRLVLGTWQRVLLVELDGPRRRTVQVTVVNSAPQTVGTGPLTVPDPPAPDTHRPVRF